MWKRLIMRAWTMLDFLPCLILSAALTGCMNDESKPPGPPPQTAISPAAAPAVDAAMANLTKRTGVSRESMTVVRIENVEWPNSSLGCPQPDRMYAQVITPGFRIVIAAGGRNHTYHTDRGSRVVLCER